MPTPRIPFSLSLDGLGPDARAAFDLAASTGYSGVAFATNHPQLAPADLGESARRHLRKTLENRRLSLEALRIAAPRAGLTDPATIDRTMDNARAAIRLAHDLGVHTVALYTGPLSPDKLDALTGPARQLAAEADRAGLTLALAADAADPLRQLLATVAYDRARANFAPAGAIAAGDDPLQAAEKLAGLIAECTLADAIRAGQQVRPVELGEGQVPLPELWRLLQEQGFRGPAVVEVRDLPDKVRGVHRAAETLRRLLLGSS